MIKISDFIRNYDYFTLGCFLSRFEYDEKRNVFITYTSFKKSKKHKNNNDFDKYVQSYFEKINDLCKLKYWNYNKCNGNIKNNKISFFLENDLNLSDREFFNKLLLIILNDNNLSDESLNFYKQLFISGFFETRASLDLILNFLSLDLFYNNEFELKNKIHIIWNVLKIPIEYINLNFREMQKDYYLNKKRRNTQIRLNLKWYIRTIGLLNKYKAEIIEHNWNLNSLYKNGYFVFKTNIENENHSSNFLKSYLNYIDLNILELRNKPIEEIEKARNLFFQKSFFSESSIKRNNKIVEYVLENMEHKCFGCCDKYKLSERTFIHKKYETENRYYLEVHHNIPLSNDKELDIVDNLVKLCPICHKCLKKNLGTESEQKLIIESILSNSHIIYEYSKNYFSTNEKNILIEKIYNSLK